MCLCGIAGIGFGMMQLPSIVIVSFYFERRRALATSIVLCGSGVGRLVLAPLSRYLIDKYGWRGANCLLAALVLHGAACGCVYRPIAGPVHARSSRRPVGTRRPGCAVIEKVIAEKRRRRFASTGSLDGTLITSDGRLLRQNDTDAEPASASTVSDGNPCRPLSAPGRQLQQSSRDLPGSTAAGSRPRTRSVSGPASTSTPSLRDSVPFNSDSCVATTVENYSSVRSSCSVAVSTVRPRPRTFSEPVSLCDVGETGVLSAWFRSASPRRTASAETCSSLYLDGVTVTDQDVEVAEEASNVRSEASTSGTAVWVTESGVSNSCRVERHECATSCDAVEANDDFELPSSTPCSSSCASHSQSRSLCSRPDLFYPGNCSQVYLKGCAYNPAHILDLARTNPNPKTLTLFLTITALTVAILT